MKKIAILMLISLSLEAALQQRKSNQGSIKILCHGATLHLNRPEFDEVVIFFCKKSNYVTQPNRKQLCDRNGNLKPGMLTLDFSLMTQKDLADHIAKIEKSEELVTFICIDT